MKKYLTLLFSAVFTGTFAQQHQLTKLWESPHLAVPESALLNEKKDFMYTALIDGDASASDGKGGIAKVNTRGKILDSAWVKGLNAPKGMAKWGNKLYVADIKELVVINTSNAKIEAKIPVEGSVFLNDVTADKTGNIFVSDTRTGKVYKIKNNHVELWLNDVPNANGLKAINDDLYILSGTNVMKADKNKQLTIIAKDLAKNGDGIEQLNNGDFIVTCWNGLIYYVTPNGSAELLLDTQEQKINTADLALDSAKGIIYIPTFNHRSIIAYQLKNK